MNVTLAFLEDCQDYFNSLVIEKETGPEEFIFILLSRLFFYPLMTLLKLIFYFFNFNFSERVSRSERIVFYFGEFFIFMTIPYYFVLYYFIRILTFLLLVGVELLIIYVETWMQYAYHYFVTDMAEGSHPNAENISLDNEVKFQSFFYEFKTFKKEYKLVAFRIKNFFYKSSLQFLCVYCYYFIVIIVWDDHLFPFLMKWLKIIMRKLTLRILKLIDKLTFIKNKVVAAYKAVHRFFFVYGRKRKLLRIRCLLRNILKLIFLIFIYFFKTLFFYIYFFIAKLLLYLFTVVNPYYRILKILKSFYVYLYFIVFEILLNKRTLTKLWTRIAGLLLLWFEKKEKEIDKYFLAVYLDLFIITSHVNFLFYRFTTRYYTPKMSSFFVNRSYYVGELLEFVYLHFYILAVGVFIHIFQLLITAEGFFDFSWYHVQKIFFFFQQKVYNIINNLIYSYFVFYIAFLYFNNFKTLFFIECLLLFHTLKFFLHVKYLVLVYNIKLVECNILFFIENRKQK